MSKKGIIIDIGTGDGKFVYELAKEYPDRLIIGIDPAHGPLEKLSAKINKKPAKGGLPNAMYVLAAVEDLPDELTDIANQVFINFPWRGLLRGIVMCDQLVWKNIRKVCKKGAFVDIVFGYDQEAEGHEMAEQGLPDITDDYIENHMIPTLRSFNFLSVDSFQIDHNHLKDFPSSWSRKLYFGQDRRFYYIRLQAI